MIVKFVASVLMLPVALLAAAVVEAYFLFLLAGMIVIGFPIIILGAVLGVQWRDSPSEHFQWIGMNIFEQPVKIFSKFYGNVWNMP
ncbi:hypothetical protein [Streptomyces luteocolor]|uniref:hypothetical protein n=1 Tax=Streptomyces luteocolor TaxID=285500 RepID=UPI000853B0FD|nr:hypothetical protein [Streptomyces luteocolor]